MEQKKKIVRKTSTLASGQGVKFDVTEDEDEPLPAKSLADRMQAAIGRKGS